MRNKVSLLAVALVSALTVGNYIGCEILTDPGNGGGNGGGTNDTVIVRDDSAGHDAGDDHGGHGEGEAGDDHHGGNSGHGGSGHHGGADDSTHFEDHNDSTGHHGGGGADDSLAHG